MIDYNKLIIEPLVTEKTNIQRSENQYCFRVHKCMDKFLIKKALKNIFNVSVLRCNVINVKKRSHTSHRQKVSSVKSFKKAIVVLRKGESFDFYEGV